jgi:hypothetical protein
MTPRRHWGTMLPMRSTWDAEDDARAVVASIVVGRATPTDPGGGSEPLHDFDVERFDGNRLAVEVTRCTDPFTFEAQVEIDWRVWLSTGLTHSWNAGFARPIGVETIAQELVGALVLIEQAGLETLRLRPCFFDGTAISQMEPADRPHATRLMSAGLQDVARTWYHLGARSFVRAERGEPSVGGEVRVVLQRSGAWTGPSALVDVAEEYGSKLDTMSKLAKATGYAERHLFVWIDSSATEPFSAFGSKDLVRGLAEPHVPRAIDAVWLASTLNQVVRWHRQEGWRDFGVWRA